MAAGGESDLLNVFESDRQNLMKHLLDAVKQCQVQFGGKKELATEKDSCVQCLLAQFENAFLHGLKRGKVWGAINSLSEPLRHVPGIKVLSGIPEAEISRCWLRSCFNEASLERRLIDLLANKTILRQFYEEWALFLDEERSSTLPVMARGLGFILFAINIENGQLNASLKQPSFPRTNMALAPVQTKSKHDPLSVTVEKDHSIVNKKKRKKKVKQATIEEIEVPEDEPPSDQGKKTIEQPFSCRDEEQINSSNILSTQRDELRDSGKAFSCIGSIEGDRNNVKAHRRATSLESSEIIRHKRDLYGYDPQVPNDFEVPTFGINQKQSTSAENVGATRIASKRVQNSVTRPLGVNPDYTNILSKLVNLSTSFKTSITSGFGQNSNVNKEDEIVPEKYQIDVSNENEDVDSLFEDEEDIFTARTKLEMREESREESPVKSCPDVTEPAMSLNHNPSTDGCRNEIRRNSSELLDDVLAKGQPISSRKNTVEEKNIVVTSTPPPTPAGSFISQIKIDNISSVGLEERLKEIQHQSKPQSETNNVRTEVDDMQNYASENNAEKKGGGAVREESSKIDEDKADSASVSSSNTGSVYDDFDVMQPVGFESEKFEGMVLTYDRQSSQATNDMLQLLRASADVELTEDKNAEKTEGLGNIVRPYLNEKSHNSTDCSDLSTAELKQAILSTAKRKDEVEERNRVLKLALDEERESTMSLSSENETLKKRLEGQQETNERQIAEVTRENEVLRNQLKKYVAAVQLLKRENKSLSKETKQAISTLRGYDEDSEVVLPPQPKERTDSELDSIYEEKLIQMAQLHGELMEFHESLQRDLVRKQNVIASMKSELVSLRGPLPESVEDSNQSDVTESHQTRQLINIWIPSVFIKGKGSDAHHLYQIYIRIGDEEWNIYRRYSQFHKTHMTTCKSYPELDKVSFPPKKIIGKKDLKFVEGRRKKLQDYIRKLINIILAKNVSLADYPSKENLEKSLPFFSEEFNNDAKKTKEKSKKKQAKPAVYTGL
eukprot:gene9186-16860_t